MQDDPNAAGEGAPAATAPAGALTRWLPVIVIAGLMTLVFFSHRRGYDDRANRFDE